MNVSPSRYRLTFSKGEEVKYISHLDLMRSLERALRRADLPLDYSLGFNPRPKISIAAPLAVGVTGTAELMDVILYRPVDPQSLLERLNASLPGGVRILAARNVPLRCNHWSGPPSMRWWYKRTLPRERFKAGLTASRLPARSRASGNAPPKCATTTSGH